MEGPRPWAQVFVGQQWVHEADGTATTFNRILTFLTSARKDDMLQGQKTEGDVKYLNHLAFHTIWTFIYSEKNEHIFPTFALSL